MYAFDYVKPTSLAEALTALQAEDAQAISGGQTLIPTLKQRLAQPSVLVDLTGVPELKGVCASDGSISIGAATRHAEIERSDVVRERIPSLAETAGHVGDPQVRNRGTLGGSIANNDPSACYPAAALALNAVIVTSGREIAADDFFQGLYTTALEDGEIVTAVRFPIAEAGAYQKFVQPASRFALVGVYVAKTGGAVRVAVTGASEEGVFRHAVLEQALTASFTPEAVDAVAAVSADGLIDDVHGSPAYRAHLIKVMTKRAVAAM